MSTISIGAMNQLGDAFEKAGWTTGDVTKLKQFKELGKVRDILSGKAFIAYSEHFIDCDANPFIPENLEVEEHKKGGQLKFDSTKISLYLHKKQKNVTINGNGLKKELSAKPVMNANVLDYLLAHPELIPESWKGKEIYFWGTIYRNSDGFLYVRYLACHGTTWHEGSNWLANGFDSGQPAVLVN